ncbi:hypothetical protein [Rufibacter hautae]|uniref:EF-hand domain-containing protein n=1 Tax=Rufibacter hautae TaxID=2595005 RepID=A0A5B6TD60_9BACT|nr:hypothetical protein [Rufibacter hautae]KAA3438399.1 hypothetical protein FOA19_14255 [Rufibacter hautae]
MDKLTTYNQRLLAIIGTLIVGGLLIVLLIGAFVLGSELFGSRRADDDEDSSRDSFSLRPSGNRNDGDTNSKGAGPKTDIKLTFESPELIDTVKQLYLIPVTLADPDQALVTDSYDVTNEPDIESSARTGVFEHQGSYLNIIVYNQLAGNGQMVYKKPVHINGFRNYLFKGKQYLLIKASNQDTDKNGRLSYRDLQAFYVYDVEVNQLQEISFPNMGLQEYTLLHNSDEIALTFGVDQNQNGKLWDEPTVLKKYSLATRRATDLLDKRLVNQLQQIGK